MRTYNNIFWGILFLALLGGLWPETALACHGQSLREENTFCASALFTGEQSIPRAYCEDCPVISCQHPCGPCYDHHGTPTQPVISPMGARPLTSPSQAESLSAGQHRFNLRHTVQAQPAGARMHHAGPTLALRVLRTVVLLN